MGVLEPITHKEEIEKLINDAQSMYDSAVKKLENQKKRTANSLEKLGQQKLDIWSNEMQDFLVTFNQFNTLQMVNNVSNTYNFEGQNESPKELMLNIEKASLTAQETLKIGALSLGTGALVGIAAYGGAMMFGHASTGTAIAALHGAAKTNATLAWFGKGSLKSGGFGMLGGKLAIAGIVVAPILIVGGVIVAAKSKEKLAEAKKAYAEAEQAVAQMKTVTSGMKAIEKMSENYRSFLHQLSMTFNPFITDMKRMIEEYEPAEDGKISFDQLSEMEQRTLHLSWLLAQLLYHNLSVTILTDDGKVSNESKKVLKKANDEFNALATDVNQLNEEKAQIRQLLEGAKNSLATSKENYSNQKAVTRDALVKYGQDKISWYINNFYLYIDAIDDFNNFTIPNLLTNNIFGGEMPSILRVAKTTINNSYHMAQNGVEGLSTSTLIEIGAFNGVTVISANCQEDVQTPEAESQFALWLSEEMDGDSSLQYQYAGASYMNIITAEDIVQCITGKENLEQAKQLNAGVMQNLSAINYSINELAKITERINVVKNSLNAIHKTILPFIDEIKNIKCQHNVVENSNTEYSSLPIDEQKIIEVSWNIAKMQYFILTAPVATGLTSVPLTADAVALASNAELKSFIKKTFKMTGEYTKAANIIWKPHAEKSKIINFVAVGVFALLTVLQLFGEYWFGLIGLASAAIAFPSFFYFKDLSQSKLLLWRNIRLAISIIVFLLVEFLGLVI